MTKQSFMKDEMLHIDVIYPYEANCKPFFFFTNSNIFSSSCLLKTFLAASFHAVVKLKLPFSNPGNKTLGKLKNPTFYVLMDRSGDLNL